MLIDFSVLYQTIKERLIAIGCNEEQAENVTHSLMMAEACGVGTHGLRMLHDHIVKIQNGFYDIHEDISIEHKTVTFARVNCHGMIGMDSAVKCMQMAIDGCKESGIFTIFANNANTFSAAFLYTLQAAKQGMIGVAVSNAPAKMPAYGGKEKLLGTNPLSYAIPASEREPIIFDMATSIVAQSKINMAKDRGEDIPEGWALDSDGNPTTNALEACKGMILPMAGAKGYGLSMMIDLIAGLLSGAAYLDGVGRFYNDNNIPMNVGQMFIAIDPVQIYGEGFYDLVDNYIKKVKESTSSTDNGVKLPGEHKYDKYKECMNKGVFISDELQNILMKCGITFSGGQ